MDEIEFSLKLSYCCGATDNAIGVSLRACAEKFSLFSESAKGVLRPAEVVTTVSARVLHRRFVGQMSAKLLVEIRQSGID